MVKSAEVQFRQAEDGDARRVLSIKQTAIESTADTYSEAQIDAWRPTAEALPAFERAVNSEQFVVLLAETGDVAAGYGVLNTEAARVEAVYVDPAHAGVGIGSSLVGQLETRARMLGLAAVDVVASVNAAPFYASLGYERVEPRTRTIDGVDVEFVAMHRSLEC